MRHDLICSVLFSLVTATIGCGGSTSTGVISGADAGGADGGVSAMQACADSANAFCTKEASCSTIDVATVYGTTCVQRRIDNCVNALSAPGTGNTPANIEACVAAYPMWSCTDFSNGENVPAACLTPHGSVASGGACAFPAQCATGDCSILKGAACGTCAIAPTGGSSCSSTARCGQNYYCTKYSQICAQHPAAGAACDKDLTCGYGLSCVGADAKTSTQGKCAVAVAVAGAPCDPTQATGAGCERSQGLSCNRTTKLCAPFLIAMTGQACGAIDPGGANTLCTAGADCNITDDKANTGTCAGPAADGATCDTSVADACLSPASCVGSVVDGGVSGMCALPNASTCH